MGVEKDINDESPTVILPGLLILKVNSSCLIKYFPGESHCSDMSSINPEFDSQDMIESKERIFSLIKTWVGVNES